MTSDLPFHLLESMVCFFQPSKSTLVYTLLTQLKYKIVTYVAVYAIT